MDVVGLSLLQASDQASLTSWLPTFGTTYCLILTATNIFQVAWDKVHYWDVINMINVELRDKMTSALNIRKILSINFAFGWA